MAKGMIACNPHRTAFPFFGNEVCLLFPLLCISSRTSHILHAKTWDISVRIRYCRKTTQFLVWNQLYDYPNLFFTRITCPQMSLSINDTILQDSQHSHPSITSVTITSFTVSLKYLGPELVRVIQDETDIVTRFPQENRRTKENKVVTRRRSSPEVRKE